MHIHCVFTLFSFILCASLFIMAFDPLSNVIPISSLLNYNTWYSLSESLTMSSCYVSIPHRRVHRHHHIRLIFSPIEHTLQRSFALTRCCFLSIFFLNNNNHHYGYIYRITRIPFSVLVSFLFYIFIFCYIDYILEYSS